MKTGEKIQIELTAVETEDNTCHRCDLCHTIYCDMLGEIETPCKDENIIFKIDEEIG